MRVIAKLFCITCLVCHLPVSAAAQDCRVAGTIAFYRTGSITIKLCTEKEFEQPEQARFVTVLTVDASTLKNGSLPFEFTRVPPGRYALRCFQDVNENGKLDMGLFGPAEPYGFHKPMLNMKRAPKFQEIAFDAPRDSDEIRITLH